MGLATHPTPKTTARIVYCGDPDVTPRNKEDCGWIYAAEAHVSSGASVLEVKPLDIDQRAFCNDGMSNGIHTLSLRRSRTSLVSVDGEKGDEACEAFLDALTPDQAPSLLMHLGTFVDDLTNGADPQPRQRRFFRGGGDDADVVDPGADEQTDGTDSEPAL